MDQTEKLLRALKALIPLFVLFALMLLPWFFRFVRVTVSNIVGPVIGNVSHVRAEHRQRGRTCGRGAKPLNSV